MSEGKAFNRDGGDSGDKTKVGSSKDAKKFKIGRVFLLKSDFDRGDFNVVVYESPDALQ